MMQSFIDEFFFFQRKDLNLNFRLYPLKDKKKGYMNVLFELLKTKLSMSISQGLNEGWAFVGGRLDVQLTEQHVDAQLNENLALV